MTKGTIKDVWAVHEKRKERIRLKQREWVQRNRDKVNAYKAATKERKRAVYHCPELTYRGKVND
jgi:hypothetical protein